MKTITLFDSFQNRHISFRVDDMSKPIIRRFYKNMIFKAEEEDFTDSVIVFWELFIIKRLSDINEEQFIEICENNNI